MKKVYIILFFLLMATLLVFSVFGDSFYRAGKPRVSARRITSLAGASELRIPAQSVVYEGSDTYVYLFNSEESYSRVINTVEKTGIKIISENHRENTVDIIQDNHINVGGTVVYSADKSLRDGMRVVLIN